MKKKKRRRRDRELHRSLQIVNCTHGDRELHSGSSSLLWIFLSNGFPSFFFLSLLPHNLLSSSCRSFNRPLRSVLRRQIAPLFVVQIVQSPTQICSSLLFFVVRSLVLRHQIVRDSAVLFRNRVFKTRDLCGIFCPTHPAQRLVKRVFETRVLI